MLVAYRSWQCHPDSQYEPSQDWEQAGLNADTTTEEVAPDIVEEFVGRRQDIEEREHTNTCM